MSVEYKHNNKINKNLGNVNNNTTTNNFLGVHNLTANTTTSTYNN